MLPSTASFLFSRLSGSAATKPTPYCLHVFLFPPKSPCFPDRVYNSLPLLPSPRSCLSPPVSRFRFSTCVYVFARIKLRIIEQSDPFYFLFFISSYLSPMDLIITILPVDTKDLPISPRCTPYNFLSRCKFSTLHNSSTNG